MRLILTSNFLILVLIFSTTCTNFHQDQQLTARIHQKEAFQATYLDSAANKLLFFHTLATGPAYKNPYGFGDRDIVLYPDSVYAQRIASMTSDFSLRFNDQVKDYIEIYAFRKKELTERMLGKSSLYFPHIEQTLHKHQLPQELKLLTMIESALRPEAESSKSAAGLWQLRFNTGRSLGLTIDAYVDERKDPYASTEAGVLYLKKLHSMYQDWWLTIAAYNYGMGNLNKAIVRAGGSRNYWDVEPYLPQETRHYVPAFMAMVYLYQYQEEHNLHPQMPEVSFAATDTVRIYHQITFDEIAHYTGLNKDDIVMLNPAFVKQVIPASKNGVRVVLPMNKVAVFEQSRPEILRNQHRQRDIIRTAQVIKGRVPVVPQDKALVKVMHTIKQGNTLDQLSRQYACSVNDLMEWNGMVDPLLQVGTELKVYIPEEQAYATTPDKPSESLSDGLLSASADTK